MEANKLVQEAVPMNGGDGPNSYVKNSSLQGSVSNDANSQIREAVLDKLDLNLLSNANPFRISDLGCSTGPNTFLAVQSIIEAIEQKYQTSQLGSKIPEFQVFFSDLASNDFNILFASLPPERRYFAAGVPGSFHTRLFPEESIHFVHSALALQWLSKVPKEIADVNSPAWNKGRIHYNSAASVVVEAYTAQYARDMGSFLDARAKEVVNGGLVALVFSIVPNGTGHAQTLPGATFDLLGSSLLEMVKTGLVSEDQVDSFNLPVYTPSPKEVEDLVAKNGRFLIEKFEKVRRPQLQKGGFTSDIMSKHTRAGFEGIIKGYFGGEIIDELFQLFSVKLKESFIFLRSLITTEPYILLLQKVG